MKSSETQGWILVTGANGFVGSHLVRKLVERGERVKALVRPESNLKPLAGLPLDRVRIAVGDVRVDHTVYRALRGCDRMYHVASTYSVSERRRDTIFQDAVLGTQAACEAARRAGTEKVVITSSAATLGATDRPEPMDEQHEFNLPAANAYAVAKRDAQRAALEAVEQGIPAVIVQPSVIVGPGDWRPTPAGRMLVKYLQTSPSVPVPIVPGGFCYADVEDVVEGHILAMERGVVGERYLLGGDNLSHREFYETLSDITGLAEPSGEKSEALALFGAWLDEVTSAWQGREPLLTRRMVRDYYGRYVYVDSGKAARELGYRHRPAREALTRAVRWYLENGYVPEHAARRARLELRPA
ncbi:MAG: NAD-dependent epimerase/dehydratase family protein [Myxococcales bacterium]|nr:NAD-dependent epimerase/dehydratase family protein [Myxococcales bacterium]